MGGVGEEWADALLGDVRLRREPDGSVLESGPHGRRWRPVYDDGPISNCWCRFGATDREVTGPELATVRAGPGWERVYVCRSCRADPSLPWVGRERS